MQGKKLLDLSNRNHLLNTPRHRRRSRALEIVDELSEEIFRILVSERKAMSFLPGREPGEGEDREDGDDIFAGLIQPEGDEVDECGIAKRLLHPGEFSPGLNPHTVIFLVHPGFPGKWSAFHLSTWFPPFIRWQSFCPIWQGTQRGIFRKISTWMKVRFVSCLYESFFVFSFIH